MRHLIPHTLTFLVAGHKTEEKIEVDLAPEEELLFIKKLIKDYPWLQGVSDLILSGGLEYLVCFLIVVFAANYLYGYSRNWRIANLWLDSSRNTIFENFSRIGTESAKL